MGHMEELCKRFTGSGLKKETILVSNSASENKKVASAADFICWL